MATIHIDGQSYEVGEGQNLLAATLSLGIDLPYFCWHPALGSVGACRQCAVVQYRDAEDEQGRLVMACMTPAADGTRISVAAPSAREFRGSVIEWLMINHPHDCPVCEEGGECHLQDMTVKAGHTFRRYRGRKRTFRNQYLGPFINHEMNRCITCYRCVRFYRDYAGGVDLEDFGSRDRVYFGRYADGTLENEFSGNLVEVCPTGVFTDKPFARRYVRKWDLQSAPSVCPGCSMGCNILPAERGGVLRRIHNRYHGEVNGYFICDRGRFGADWVNDRQRLVTAGRRCDDGSFERIESEEALEAFGEALAADRVVGVGSPRASVETNFALARLVGEASFSPGLAQDEAALVDAAVSMQRDGPGHLPSLREIERADAIVVLGEDVLDTAPRLALALRQATRQAKLERAERAGIPAWQDAGVRNHGQWSASPAFAATPLPTRLDDIFTEALHVPPESIGRVAFALAHAIDGRFADAGPLGEGEQAFVDAAAAALRDAERPLVVSGTGARSKTVLEGAANVAAALEGAERGAGLYLVAGECNAFGASLLGGELDVEGVLAALEAGEVDTLVVAENDLTRRADPERVEAVLRRAQTLVVLDVLETATAARADLVLPAAAFVESEGTFVSSEGRAQRFFQVYPPETDVQPGWRWLAEAAGRAGRNDLAWRHVDEVIAACSEAVAPLAGIRAAAPDAGYRNPGRVRVPRQPHRYSGRTALYADRSVHEPKPPVDEESPLTFSMEGINRPEEPGALVPEFEPGRDALSGGDQRSAARWRSGRAGVGAPGSRRARGAVPAPVARGRWRNAVGAALSHLRQRRALRAQSGHPRAHAPSLPRAASGGRGGARRGRWRRGAAQRERPAPG